MREPASESDDESDSGKEGRGDEGGMHSSGRPCSAPWQTLTLMLTPTQTLTLTVGDEGGTLQTLLNAMANLVDERERKSKKV